VESAVDDIIEALKSCDYSRCTSGKLEELRKAVAATMEDKQQHANFMAFVEEHGRLAFQRLDHPHLHRLLYGVLKIPAITSRLECMILESTFAEHMEHYHSNLNILCSAFDCVLRRLGPLRRFFMTATRLGNALNLDSHAPVTEYGFKLSSISKFVELKSPSRKELSLRRRQSPLRSRRSRCGVQGKMCR